jgi:hypothetical protein
MRPCIPNSDVRKTLKWRSGERSSHAQKSSKKMEDNSTSDEPDEEMLREVLKNIREFEDLINEERKNSPFTLDYLLENSPGTNIRNISKFLGKYPFDSYEGMLILIKNDVLNIEKVSSIIKGSSEPAKQMLDYILLCGNRIEVKQMRRDFKDICKNKSVKYRDVKKEVMATGLVYIVDEFMMEPYFEDPFGDFEPFYLIPYEVEQVIRKTGLMTYS